MLIDSHVNISEKGVWFNTGLDASTKNILYEMDLNSVDKAFLLAIHPTCSNQYLYNFIKPFKNRFIPFGTVDFTNYKKSLYEIEKLGFRCIKIHPRLQNITINELQEFGIFKWINDRKYILNICGWQQSNTVAMEDIQPISLDRIAKTNPDSLIIISHMGCHKMWDSIFVARSNPNVYLDCSYFLNFFANTSLIKDFYSILPKISKKIMFGSDFPECSISDSINIINDNVIDKDLKKDLFYNTAHNVISQL